MLASCAWNRSAGQQPQTSVPLAWTPQSLSEAGPALPTPIPTSAVEAAPTQDGLTFSYYAQSGDWLPAVANRFGVGVSEIKSPETISETRLIDPGTLLIIPNRLDQNLPRTPSVQILPDSEVVYSASALDFDIDGYVRKVAGYLSTYRLDFETATGSTGAQMIERMGLENSINPRLLLALLDYEGHWVRGNPENQSRIDYPMGYEDLQFKGLYNQMRWAIDQLSTGYYGWRSGSLRELNFRDSSTLRMDPTLNAGTVALMYLFSHSHSLNEWSHIMDERSGFAAFYRNIYGDPQARADALGDLFPSHLRQPDLVLPFEANVTWSFTGGPHSAWGTNGPLAAIDFAPADDQNGCFTSTAWIRSVASGLVVRSGDGVVMVDLDGDGSELTGWNILYLHVAARDRVVLGQWVQQDNHIGHPSCEGGAATGTHMHLARKYNGEWIQADGPIPFMLSGWRVLAGDEPYSGKLVKGTDVVTADGYGQASSLIRRNDEK
jgi:LasA protease